MNQTAVKQANERLVRARDAHLRIVESDKSLAPFAVTAAAWTDFLLAASVIYSKLGRGSRGHGTSEAWFGRLKHERKTDQLLSYIHHARNADEHGIGATTNPLPHHFGEIKQEPSGTPGLVNVTIKIHISLMLMPVYDDRFGDMFPVPTTHLGQPVEDPSPAEVSRLALQYLERIVAEAATLVE
jgi:hypothetical protein